MSSGLEYVAKFIGIDDASGVIKKIGDNLDQLGRAAGSAGDQLGRLGERMESWGEKTALWGAVFSMGADKLNQWTDKMLEPAIGMSDAMARLAGATAMGAKALDEIREHAIAFSDTHPEVTAEGWIAGFEKARQEFNSTADAIKAADIATRLSSFSNIDAATGVGFLASAHMNLGLSAQQAADMLAATQHQFGVNNVQQFAYSLARLSGTAKNTHSSASELFAILGEAGKAIPGGRGAQMFASLFQEIESASSQGKLSVDFSHGLLGGLEQMRAQMMSIAPEARANWLKSVGLSGEATMLEPLLDHLDEVRGKMDAVTNSAGQFGKSAQTAESGAGASYAKLGHTLENLADAIARPALGPLTAEIGMLADAAQGLDTWFSGHQTLSKYLIAPLATLAGVLTIGAGAMAGLGAAAGIAGKGIGIVAGGMKLMKGLELGTSLAGMASSLMSFGAMTIPFLPWIAAAAALAAVGYEVYEHWDAIKNFFAGLWESTKSICAGFADWIVKWAPTIGKAILIGLTGPFGLIAYELYKHFDEIKAAAEKIAGGIGRFFIGHSPPPEGPLSRLGDTHLGETIADSIRPAPARRAAAALAGVIAMTAVAPAGAAPAYAPAAAPIVINYSPTINASPGATAGDFDQVLRDHARTIAELVDRELAVRQRRNY